MEIGISDDDDRNLMFEHELTPTQDDESEPTSGTVRIENKFCREGGQPDDLPADHQDIEWHDDDLQRDKEKVRHAECGAQERKFLFSFAKWEPGSAAVNGKVVDGRGLPSMWADAARPT